MEQEGEWIVKGVMCVATGGSPQIDVGNVVCRLDGNAKLWILLIVR
jgi:hypothetical protein